MKVLFISLMSESPWGGSEILWSRLAKHCLNLKYDVTISYKEWNEIPKSLLELRASGASLRFRNNGNKGTLKKILGYLISRPSQDHWNNIKEVISSSDIILINQGGTYDILYFNSLVNLLQDLKKRYFLICQFNDEIRSIPTEARFRLVKIFKGAKKLFFVSMRNKINAERHLATNFENYRIIQNPSNAVSRRLIAWPKSNVTVFATVARLHCVFKGQDLLLRVLSYEKWKKRSWELKLYGNGPDKEYLQGLASLYDLKNRVSFKGHVQNIEDIWTKSHCLILPSIGEGTPLSLLEAMACGRMVIGTDVGGIGEWINHGQNGFIIDAPTEKHIDLALEEAWIQSSRWEEMGAQAFDFIENNLEINPEISLLNEILN